MKLLTFFMTLVVVGLFSYMSLDDSDFVTAAVWIFLPMLVGYLLKRTGIPDIREIGWGMFFGAITVFAVLTSILIYLLATWKMTRLF